VLPACAVCPRSLLPPFSLPALSVPVPFFYPPPVCDICLRLSLLSLLPPASSTHIFLFCHPPSPISSIYISHFSITPSVCIICLHISFINFSRLCYLPLYSSSILSTLSFNSFYAFLSPSLRSFSI